MVSLMNRYSPCNTVLCVMKHRLSNMRRIRKVPLVKSADKWVVSLSQLPLLLTDGGSVRGNDSGEGVGYSDYIRMFLFLKSVPEITMRTLDCVEESFHSKHILFQADQCVTKLEIQNKIIVYKNLSYQYPVYFGYE